MPSFGYVANFFIDQNVLEREFVYSGGGDDHSLVKIGSKVLVAANGGDVVDLRNTKTST